MTGKTKLQLALAGEKRTCYPPVAIPTYNYQPDNKGEQMQKTCKSCGDIFSADQDWKTYCIPCFIKMKRAQEGEQTTVVIQSKYSLDEEMLNRVIRLCHPDKHKSSEASHVATVFLLGMRDEMRGAK